MREALRDYFASGAWKAFVEDLSGFMGTSVCYLVLDHREELWTHRRDNALCARVRAEARGQALCRRDHEEHLEACRLSGRPGLYICHMGLVRIVIPVSLPDGTTIYLGMCGVRHWRIVPDGLLEHAVAAGVPSAEVRALHPSVQYVPMKRLKVLMRILEHLIRSIVELVALKEQLKALATRPSA